MTGAASSGKRSAVFELLENYCGRNGLRLTAGDPHGHAGRVESPAGKCWFFKGTRFDLNTYGAAEIANDKAYASGFLKRSGIAVPAGRFVLSADIRNTEPLPKDVLDFAGQTGFPLFVKPNEGQEGRGVMRAETHQTLQNALHLLAKDHTSMLVQEEVRGTDLRVVVLDGEVLCAFERHPPTVTGDGTSGLRKLVLAQAKIDPDDSRIPAELSRQSLTLESVPAAGRTVTLLPVSNLSSGGTARVVTETLAPEIRDISSRAVKALGLRYAGVDLIVPNQPRPGTAAVVLEVNAAPGLNNLYRQGPDEAEIVAGTYEKVFAALFGA